MRKLVVKGQYLAYDNGDPFFWLGDTAWELFHKLTDEDAELYFKTRQRQGYNVIQSVFLAEFDGVNTPDAYGNKVLDSYNEKQIVVNEEYFKNVDRKIALAEKYGLYVALVTTWGDKFNKKEFGVGPEILTPENSYHFASTLAKRYAEKENIIWVLIGDRPLENDYHRAILDSLGKGIKDFDKNHLVTSHPSGASCSYDYLPFKDYMDFHMCQSGHDSDTCYKSYDMIRKGLALEGKPVIDAECRYEKHPACFRVYSEYFWDARDLRQNSYQNILVGAFGQTYGNHPIWCFCTEPTDYFPKHWKDSLEDEGANQMVHLKNLRLSRDYFSLREAPELLISPIQPNLNKIICAKGKDYGFVYSPLGESFVLDLSQFKGVRVRATWYDVKTGECTVDGVYPTDKILFVPEKRGKGNDALLIIDEIEDR